MARIPTETIQNFVKKKKRLEAAAATHCGLACYASFMKTWLGQLGVKVAFTKR